MTDPSTALTNGDLHALTGLGTQVEVLRQAVSSLQAQFVESRGVQNARIGELAAAMQTGFDKQTAVIEALRSSITKPPDKSLWIGAVGVLLALGTAGVAFISIEAQLTVGPVKSEVEALKAASDAGVLVFGKMGDQLRDHDALLRTNDSRDARSEQDRADLGRRIETAEVNLSRRLDTADADLSKRVDHNNDQISQLQSDQRGVQEALREVETQIDSVEQTRNTADDTLRRDIARLSEALSIPYRLPVEPSPRIAERRR